MFTIFSLLVLCLSAVTAVPAHPGQRIVGGSQAAISTYPSITSLLNLQSGIWSHRCGGTVLSSRAVVTAAHCLFADQPTNWRMRLGSASSISGGTINYVSRIIVNPNFNRNTRDNDIAVLRPLMIIQLINNVRPALYAGANYNLPDNSVVWAAGWGATFAGGPNVQSLRHVQVWTVNNAVCRQRYINIRFVTANMLCSGWLDVGGRDQCQGDSGGPLYHNRVLVGISSWGYGCGLPGFPGVNARVSRFAAWIANNI